MLKRESSRVELGQVPTRKERKREREKGGPRLPSGRQAVHICVCLILLKKEKEREREGREGRERSMSTLAMLASPSANSGFALYTRVMCKNCV